MRPILFALLVALSAVLSDCSQEKRLGDTSASRRIDTSVVARQPSSLRERADSEVIEHIRRLGTEFSGDTIHLYSPRRETVDVMTGRELSPDDYAFFRPFYGNIAGKGDLYAIGYTTIGPGLTVYILRVPSQYESSAIALWVHEDTKGYWLPPFNVADAFGDEEWAFQEDAWLVDKNHDGYRDVVQHRTDWDLEKVIADSLSWTFWQPNYDDFGWRQTLTDTGAVRVFTLHQPRR
jgi:hypothetical protein